MTERRRRHAAFVLLPIVLLAGQAAAQPREEHRRVAGLEAPADIRIDRWGIAHISAASTRDAFFLQGYNAARDRLWQIDLWRKRGLGLLAANFGPAYVAQDRASRLFLYRGSMRREWAAYGPGARDAARAFVAGINAYVGEVLAGTRPLPLEFRLTDTRPDVWRAEDVVRIRSHALSRNLPSEVARARLACRGNLAADRLRQDLSPAHDVAVPDGLDPCAVPEEVLGDYRLATSGVRFEPSAARPIAALASSEQAEGSNAWAVAGTRSATGRPLLASDPHREHGLPALRYVVHLETPSWSAIGAGEPALPGLSIGHNGTLAFGLTIFSADQEDLYAYTLHPRDARLYRYRGGWARMRSVRTRIAVRGGPAQMAELLYTRHGPVLHVDAARGRAFAVRTVWQEPGTAAYFAGIALPGATDGAQFRRALAGWGAPSVNQIYADGQGEIGGLVSGRIPVRPNWDGLLPVPGDGRYEWAGFRAGDDMPQPFSADRGWVASANEMNLPAGETAAIGYEWPNGARGARLAEVLGASDRVSMADMRALQTDLRNGLAAPFVTLLRPLGGQAGEAAPAIALLAAWDGEMDADSAAAALFETWTLRYLGRAVVARLVPEADRPLVGSGSLAAVTELLLRPDPRLGAAPEAVRDAILVESLRAAYADLQVRLGPDPRQWAWGRLHHAEPQHALSGVAQGEDRAALAFPRRPLPGGYLTVRASGWRPEDYRSVVGASLRMLFDVGDWDNSLVVNGPGQSGDPASPHFRDHYEPWAAGDYVPLLYSREAIAAATETWLRLEPAP